MASRPQQRPLQGRPPQGRPPQRQQQQQTGFVYKPRTREQVKQHMDQAHKRQWDLPVIQDIALYRAKDGTNWVRILPPTWEDNPTNHYAYQVWMHSRVGPNNSNYICLRKHGNQPCPICDDSEAAGREGDEDGRKRLSAYPKFFCWVVDRADEVPVPQIYIMAARNDRKLLGQSEDEVGELLNIDNPRDGYDVKIIRSGTGLQTEYELSIARRSSPLHPNADVAADLLQYVADHPIPDVLQLYDADYLSEMLSGNVEEPDQDLDVPERRTTAPAQQAAARGRIRMAEPEQEQADDQQQYDDQVEEDQGGEYDDQQGDPEPEPEPEPAPRARGRRPDPEPEAEPESAPAPRQRARRPAPADEYEEPPQTTRSRQRAEAAAPSQQRMRMGNNSGIRAAQQARR